MPSCAAGCSRRAAAHRALPATDPGRTLCNCLNVSESRICAGIARGLDLDGLKREFHCGTQCGSCVPEIRRLLASRPLAV